MPNMDPKKCPMPSQDPNVRNKNFKEVALGYTAEMAVNEAKRCLQCKKPACRTGCPVQIDIPAFIAEVAKGDFEAAYQVIAKSSALPAVCGRVCPQESQCESKCVRGIKGESVAIGRLERFVADWYRENVNAMPEKAVSNGIKVAVVGSGPAGLTCASDLAKKGYQVSIFEALHTAGGVLVYGIPEFRLPKAIVANEVRKLEAQGVEVMTNMVIGRVLTIDELFEMGYKAVFVGSGLEEYIVALLTFEAGDAVREYDLVGVPDVRLAGCVGNRRGDIIFRSDFFHCFHFSFQIKKLPYSAPVAVGRRQVCLPVIPLLFVPASRQKPLQVHVLYLSAVTGGTCRSLTVSDCCFHGSVRLSEAMFDLPLLLPSQPAKPE